MGLRVRSCLRRRAPGGESRVRRASGRMGSRRQRRDQRGFARPIPRALGRWTSWRIDHTAEALGALVERALADVGLTRRTLAVLLLLEDHGSLSQSALRERIGVDRTTITQIVHDLEHDGLVRRFPDPIDRRANAIALGPNGDAMLEEGAAASRAAHGRFLRPLSVRDRQTLAELLEDLEPKSGLAFLELVEW